MEGDALAGLFGGGVAVAVVADAAHLAREHVAQVAADELDSADGFGFCFAVVAAVFPGVGDLPGGLVVADDAVVADGGAGDVAAEGWLSRAESRRAMTVFSSLCTSRPMYRAAGYVFEFSFFILLF